jgi:hypothetical protein
MQQRDDKRRPSQKPLEKPRRYLPLYYIKANNGSIHSSQRPKLVNAGRGSLVHFGLSAIVTPLDNWRSQGSLIFVALSSAGFLQLL